MTVLVAYGTKGGSTAEIAHWIADEMRDAGLDVTVHSAAEVDDVTGYEAVILGASVYASGWHTEARRFAQRCAGQLTDRPVWLFSSGPLDFSADEADIPPVPQAQAAAQSLHARGHVTFGGKLSAEAHGWLGFLARRVASEGHGGDFRNPERIRAWAREIAKEIGAASPATRE